MSSGVVKGLQNVGEKLLSSTNLFSVWLVVWLVEVYYLAINTFYNLFSKELNGNINIPIKIKTYNEELLKYLSDYSNTLIAFALIVFCTGLYIAPLKFIPKLRDYKLINLFADYGVHCGVWLFLIWFTYIAYKALNGFFILLPLFVYIAYQVLKKIVEILKEKYNITFSG